MIYATTGACFFPQASGKPQVTLMFNKFASLDSSKSRADVANLFWHQDR